MLILLLLPLSLMGQWQIGQRGFKPLSGGGGGATITRVQSVGGDGTTLTLSATAAGNLVVVCFGTQGLSGTPSVVDSASNTYTARASSSAAETGTGLNSGCFDSITTNSGATSVTITYSGGSSYSELVAYEFHRSSGSWAFDTSGAVSNATTNASTGVASGPALSMAGPSGAAVAIFIVNGSFVINPSTGSPWTIGPTTTSGGGSNAFIATSSGLQTSTATDGVVSDPYCASGVAYK